jgi:hypothetical protein
MRWQVFTSLAYGAKGVLYYCYNSEPCGRGGVLHQKAAAGSASTGVLTRGRHFAHAKRINAVLKVFGEYQLRATIRLAFSVSS